MPHSLYKYYIKMAKYNQFYEELCSFFFFWKKEFNKVAIEAISPNESRMLLISFSNSLKVTGQNKKKCIWILQLGGGGSIGPLRNFQGLENEKELRREVEE